jgi:hypothetical protein
MTPDPLSLDRFTVRLDAAGHVTIADRDLTPLTGEVADRIMGDHEAAVIWHTSTAYGYIVFPVTDEGWAMAQTFADQLNDLDAAADAEQAAALIDNAATLAEQIEADAAPDLTTAQRRGLAAYQRAAALPPHTSGAPTAASGGPSATACGSATRLTRTTTGSWSGLG